MPAVPDGADWVLVDRARIDAAWLQLSAWLGPMRACARLGRSHCSGRRRRWTTCPLDAGHARRGRARPENAPMKHPILLALAAGLLVLVAAFAAPLWQLLHGPAAVAGASGAGAEQGLPWQVQALPEGLSRVFGLVPGVDTLAQAQARVGDGLQVALIARLGEVGTLEALADPFVAGFVSGRLVLAFEVPAEALARWRAQAARSQAMNDGVRRFALRPADLDEARRAPLVGISFVPVVRLTEADLRQRFGPPTEQRALDGGAAVLLYPALGLSASVGPASRGVLQYVAPRDFEARLRAPLGRPYKAASVP